MKLISKKLMAIALTVITLFSVMSVMVSAATVTNTEIVEYARTFEGVPYVWGGHSPAGFDCSGFVNYVFTQKGIKLNNDSEWYKTVSNYGTEVSAEEALPGDIVVWAGHVGIYLGDGWCISALSGSKNKVYVHTVASFTGGSVKLYGRPNGVDYGKSTGESYQVTSEEYNAILTYENGEFSASIIDPDLKESYPINQPNIEMNVWEHDWGIRFTDGSNCFWIVTHIYKTDDVEKNATLYEMESSILVLSGGQWNGDSSWSEVGNAMLLVEGKKLTWRFSIPDEYNFNEEKMQILEARVFHTESSQNKSFFETLKNVFERIWNFIKAPFEFLLGLFE